MPQHRTRKNKVDPHYGFLVSWKPREAGVKGELESKNKSNVYEAKNSKKADLLAKELTSRPIKKDIIKSLILVSLILILELVIYLARNKF
ncbi:MAG TPA: hypothetical protein VFI61_03770 [Patescibacteria group bacterium]|nr:hypothetical protein [Patescibacteria group bacterium]